MIKTPSLTVTVNKVIRTLGKKRKHELCSIPQARIMLDTSRKFGMPVTSAIISIVGTLTNSTSLIYFFKKGERKIGDKLLMLLNCIDLALCISAATMTVHFSSQPVHYDFASIAIMLCIYYILIDGTAYSTCILSVTRAIGIAFPFYEIRGKPLLIIGIVVFVVIELASYLLPIILFFETNLGGDDPITGLMRAHTVKTLLKLLVVVSATVVSIYKLIKKDTVQEGTEGAARNNKKATWTVLILSTLFIVFNVAFLAATAHIFQNQFFEQKPVHSLFAYLGMFIAIPLNSAINPIVYFFRINEMRYFFVQSFRGMCSN